MKHLDEFRNQELVKTLLGNIHQTITKEWSIMEICGGQTHSLAKNGILNMLPAKLTMIHGPGCPVCVTPVSIIDEAIELALKHGVTVCSFGDMLRVPGSRGSLLKAKAEGGDIRIVYSPLDALGLASGNPSGEVVFFAVGFETTAPANALSVLQAKRSGINNFSILASHVLVPPAMEALLSDPETSIDGFLAAGHVCTVMGTEEYEPVSEKYHVPVVVTGFEPVDLLQGILMCLQQLESNTAKVENQYKRVVKNKGNTDARKIIFEVFEISDREWRGIGILPASGYRIREKYKGYDAEKKYALEVSLSADDNGCIAGQILKGLKKPAECPFFGKPCDPSHPMGAPMVSSEGTCAAYYHFGFNAQ
jgi:hydrogenase expression/formation protein HypD